jgi:hypothetical protein
VDFLYHSRWLEKAGKKAPGHGGYMYRQRATLFRDITPDIVYNATVVIVMRQLVIIGQKVNDPVLPRQYHRSF